MVNDLGWKTNPQRYTSPLFPIHAVLRHFCGRRLKMRDGGRSLSHAAGSLGVSRLGLKVLLAGHHVALRFFVWLSTTGPPPRYLKYHGNASAENSAQRRLLSSQKKLLILTIQLGKAYTTQNYLTLRG